MPKAKTYSVSKLIEVLKDMNDPHLCFQPMNSFDRPITLGENIQAIIGGMGEEKFIINSPHFKWICQKLSGNTVRIEGGITVQPYFDRLDAKHKR